MAHGLKKSARAVLDASELLLVKHVLIVVGDAVLETLVLYFDQHVHCEFHCHLLLALLVRL